MDANTALVVFIFVVAIFTSLGGKVYSPIAPTAMIYQEVSVVEPDPSYSGTFGQNPGPAIETFIKKYRSESESILIADNIMRYSKTYDMNPKLVAALIARESRFNPRAVSSSGAVGLGQLLPSTAKGLGVDNPYDIEQNVKGTVRYFKSLILKFNGKVSKAIAGYLEGPNAVERQGGFSAHTKTYIEDILTTYQKI